MNTIQTRHGEATLLWVVENEDGKMEVVFEIEGLRATPFKTLKDNMNELEE